MGILLLLPRTTFSVRWMEPQNSTLEFSILSYFTGINQDFKCVHNPFRKSASLEESLSILSINSRQSLIKDFSLSRTLMNSKKPKVMLIYWNITYQNLQAIKFWVGKRKTTKTNLKQTKKIKPFIYVQENKIKIIKKNKAWELNHLLVSSPPTPIIWGAYLCCNLKRAYP